jgi:thiosulfate/3-mercaptopyruvate sulfurtransferase
VYDRTGGLWATRVWWLLRAFGFDEAGVLDGGWRAWTEEGHPVSGEPAPDWPAASFVARPRPELFVSKDEVLTALGDEASCIVNALDRDQHRGDESGYPRRGHIPGALNVPSQELLDPTTGRYLRREELAARFADVLARPRAITYCGGGIAATNDAFVLTLLGHRDVAVYDGSLVEWASDPSLPLELGD